MQGWPVLDIDLNKITENTRRVVGKCREKGVAVVGVTKGFSALLQIVEAMLSGGIKELADARIENIIALRKRKIKNYMLLLRLPRLSNVDNVVKYADASVNSEVTVIKALSEAALKIGKVHKVMLMLEVGDLREGIMRENIIDVARQVETFKNISLYGIGVNVGCFGGVLPSVKNLNVLADVVRKVERKLGRKLEVISGGGTSSLLMLENDSIPSEINQLRIGEGILLGTDTTNSRLIPWLHQNAFCLRAEVIEVKDKPSMPKGKIGKDAFGNTPMFVDEGVRKRAIVALGKQDVNIEGIFPLEENAKLLGASSDHTIIDITDVEREIKIGDEMIFGLTYQGLLSVSDSRYVEKRFRGGEIQ